MTDLEKAKEGLVGHTICLCKNGECLYSEKRGIAPMMEFIGQGMDLGGYSVADIVVGKAAAMLFVKGRLTCVYAKTISLDGKKFLERHNIMCEYETLTEHIINREGTDVCPMEKTVEHCDNANQAYILLKNKLDELRVQK